MSGDGKMKPAQLHADERKLYLVSYDISDDKRRTRVHSALTGFGIWVQYSLFECFLDQKQRIRLEARLLKEIHQREDSVRIYSLCKGCASKIEILGRGDMPQDAILYML
jgi:CRISPR-associated protein Cas2